MRIAVNKRIRECWFKNKRHCQHSVLAGEITAREFLEQLLENMELDAKIEVSGADYQELTRLLEEKEEAEMVLLDLMEQWEKAQEV